MRVREATALRPGDQIELGDTTLELVAAGGQPSANGDGVRRSRRAHDGDPAHGRQRRDPGDAADERAERLDRAAAPRTAAARRPAPERTAAGPALVPRPVGPAPVRRRPPAALGDRARAPGPGGGGGHRHRAHPERQRARPGLGHTPGHAGHGAVRRHGLRGDQLVGLRRQRHPRPALQGRQPAAAAPRLLSHRRLGLQGPAGPGRARRRPAGRGQREAHAAVRGQPELGHDRRVPHRHRRQPAAGQGLAVPQRRQGPGLGRGQRRHPHRRQQGPRRRPRPRNGRAQLHDLPHPGRRVAQAHRHDGHRAAALVPHPGLRGPRRQARLHHRGVGAAAGVRAAGPTAP